MSQSEGNHASSPGKRIEQYAADAGNVIKEHPLTAVAVAAGLAFAVGALWKLQTSRRASPLENLLARLPDLPSPERLARRWR